jgi:NADPH:quinone reductase-like Zn-dependent oxidoreductase
LIKPADRWLKALVLTRLRRGKFLTFLAKTNKADVLVLKQFAEAGQLTPVIDRTYPLAETRDAIRYVETMRARGKVVITI